MMEIMKTMMSKNSIYKSKQVKTLVKIHPTIHTLTTITTTMEATLDILMQMLKT